MGHLRLAGRLSEEERFGAKLGRLDIPGPDGAYTTRYFGGGSVYQITLVSEAAARAVAAFTTAPVSSWELPKPKALAASHEPPDPTETGFDDGDGRPF